MLQEGGDGDGDGGGDRRRCDLRARTFAFSLYDNYQCMIIDTIIWQANNVACVHTYLPFCWLLINYCDALIVLCWWQSRCQSRFSSPKTFTAKSRQYEQIPGLFSCLLASEYDTKGRGWEREEEVSLSFLRISSNSSARSHPRKRHFKSNAVDGRNVQPPTNWWLKRSRDKSRNYATHKVRHRL